MNTDPIEQLQAAAPALIAEPSLFLPRGRIGIRSMLFQWLICMAAIGVAGILLRDAPKSTQELVYACIGYPIYAFMLVTGIKRGHDMGYSAWGVILLALLPILFLLPGADQSNEYGPVPKRWL